LVLLWLRHDSYQAVVVGRGTATSRVQGWIPPARPPFTPNAHVERHPRPTRAHAGQEMEDSSTTKVGSPAAGMRRPHPKVNSLVVVGFDLDLFLQLFDFLVNQGFPFLVLRELYDFLPELLLEDLHLVRGNLSFSRDLNNLVPFGRLNGFAEFAFLQTEDDTVQLLRELPLAKVPKTPPRVFEAATDLSAISFEKSASFFNSW